METNSVCNYTSDNNIGRPHSGSSNCLSQCFDTESYRPSAIRTRSLYLGSINHKIKISKKRRIAKYERKGNLH